ncbi:HAD-IA family hydrolase [Pseudonocardia sp. GCM10023141]|uniref:HAD-IA family hydrolase n=1 Tax=Pseudonocardia sp. GCM10023141 TaxID=3252653 RepID=UPI003610FBE9
MSSLRALLMDYGGVLSDTPELAGLVTRARAAGIATALVSDAHAVPDRIAALFDVVVLGPALGARKPDPEVFRRTAAALGVTAAECVVVDDQPGNLRGARAAGAVTVRHHDQETTVFEVEVLLALPPR